VSLITIKLLDFVHRPDFYKQKTQRFASFVLASPVERQAFGFSVE
jgi:hypothetical protein